jgi:hypothetical protein
MNTHNLWDPSSCQHAIDNLQSKIATAMEKVAAVDYLTHIKSMSDAVIAEKTAIAASSIRHMRRVARQMEASLKPLLHANKISLAHIKSLIRLPKPQQRDIAERCIANKWTVPKLQQWIKEGKEYASVEQKRMYQIIADQIGEQIGFPVTIKPDSKHVNSKGIIAITYHTLDEFDAVLDRLNVQLDK